MNKALSIIFFLFGIFAIFTVIGEIRDLGAISTPLRYIDIIVRILAAGFSIAAGYGLWAIKNWAFRISLIAIALNIILRTLIFFSPHFGTRDQIANGIGIVLLFLIAAYLYSKNHSKLSTK